MSERMCFILLLHFLWYCNCGFLYKIFPILLLSLFIFFIGWYQIQATTTHWPITLCVLWSPQHYRNHFTEYIAYSSYHESRNILWNFLGSINKDNVSNVDGTTQNVTHIECKSLIRRFCYIHHEFLCLLASNYILRKVLHYP